MHISLCLLATIACIPSATSLASPPEVAGLDFDIARFADDAKWMSYIVKGQHLNCIMGATDAGAGFLIEDPRKPPSAASPWSGDLSNDMLKWFWHENDYDKSWECDFERMRLTAAFEGLGMNAKPRYDDEGNPADGDNDCFSIAHYDKEDYVDPNDEWPAMKPVIHQKYKVGDKEYTATGAYYEFAVNLKGGGIIAKNLESPSIAVIDHNNWGRKASPDELPDLRYCSDIYWGYWVRGNPDVKNLRVYGAQNVVNDDTVLLAARALKEAKKEKLTAWPGDSFEATTDAGKALIGSPIGSTIANMITRHKAELGIKHISRVIVVTNDAPRKPKFGERPKNDLNIFFQIEDVPADEVTDDKPQGADTSNVRGVRYERSEDGDGVRAHKFSSWTRSSNVA